MEWQVAVGVLFSMALLLVPACAILLLNFLEWRARGTRRSPVYVEQPVTGGTLEEQYSHHGVR